MDKRNLAPDDSGIASGSDHIGHEKTDSGFDSLGVKASQFGGNSKKATQLIGDFAAKKDAHEAIDESTELISAELPPDTLKTSDTYSDDAINEDKYDILHVFNDRRLSGVEMRKINNAAYNNPSELNNLLNEIDKQAGGGG